MNTKKSFWFTRTMKLIDSYNRICQKEVLNKQEIVDDLKGKDQIYYMQKYLSLRDKYLFLTKSFVYSSDEEVEKRHDY